MKPGHSLALLAACGALAIAAATTGVEIVAADRIRAQIADAKDGYLLSSLRTAAEGNVSIGLTLDQMDGLQALIEREREGAERVLSIDVFNGAGVVVYSTDRSAIGTPVASPWVPLLKREKTWTIEGRGERVIGTRFDNDLGEPEGGIALTLRSASPMVGGIDPLSAWRTFSLPLLASLAAAALAALLARALLQRQQACFRLVAATLAGKSPGREAHGDPLQALAIARREHWQSVGSALEARHQALGRLDDAN